jgi:hypothetical protein
MCNLLRAQLDKPAHNRQGFFANATIPLDVSIELELIVEFKSLACQIVAEVERVNGIDDSVQLH